MNAKSSAAVALLCCFATPAAADTDVPNPWGAGAVGVYTGRINSTSIKRG